MKFIGLPIFIAAALSFSINVYAQEATTLENGKPINQDALQKRLFGEPEATVPKQPKKPDFAYAAFQRGEYLTAFQTALPLAQNGDSAAQTLIAGLYEKGLGIAQDTKQAATWYEIAAKSGNREAKFAYSLKLLKGKDVPKDIKAGAQFLKEAAEEGHPTAMFNHANQIIADRPTSAGYRKALPFYEKAAENRVPDAYYALAVIYREGLTTGIQDPKKSHAWLKKAASAGVDTAKVDLGLAYLNGTDIPKDVERAFDILFSVAKEGNVIAQNRIAYMFLRGIGTELSEIEAAKWHILAKRAGRFDLTLDKFIAQMDKAQRAKAISLANRWSAS